MPPLRRFLLCGAVPAATVQAQGGVPTAPRDLAAASGDTMVTLTWSPPANDGGSDITGYQYQVDQGGWTNAGAADAGSVVVSSLENLRQYTFSVQAVNGDRAGGGRVGGGDAARRDHGAHGSPGPGGGVRGHDGDPHLVAAGGRRRFGPHGLPDSGRGSRQAG